MATPSDPAPSRPVPSRRAPSRPTALGLSRRTLLAGATASAVLVACGSGDDTGSSPAGTSPAGSNPSATNAAGSTAPGATTATAGDNTWTLVQRFPQDVQVPGPIRLPVSLSTDGAQLISDGPATLTAQVTDLDGKAIGDPITATRRDVDPGSYYDFRTTAEAAGIYYLVVDDGPSQGAAFQVMEPGTVAVPGPGDPMPPFDTPTIDDSRGVDPICTRQPDPCPFHDVTLTDALASGKQVVYLVGTPAFCQTGSCAPALESMIDVFDRFGDIYTFVHAEVYTDNTATEPTQAVASAGLSYEPALFITDTSGAVIERLDAVWDGTELVEVLEASAG